MSRRRQRLTPALAAQIAAGVRSGAFPHVAAQAFGVTAQRFDKWLKRGTGDQAREPFRSFAAAVDEAAAQARLRAEMTVLNDEPKAWLQLGPGRERGGDERTPGWTSAIKPGAARPGESNALTSEGIIILLQAVNADDSLTPEMKENVSRTLTRLDQDARKAA